MFQSRNFHIRLVWSQMGIIFEFTQKFGAICIYICLNPEIYISDHKTGITFEFTQKFSAKCICTIAEISHWIAQSEQVKFQTTWVSAVFHILLLN